MIRAVFIASVAIVLSGCASQSGPIAPAEPLGEVSAVQQPPVHLVTDQWLGKWAGVEGLNLTVSKDEAAGAGHYVLQMQYGLDANQRGAFKGQATAAGIAFTRNNAAQLLRAGDGQATGLKWLADKNNCLIVRTGEGYCRD